MNTEPTNDKAAGLAGAGGFEIESDYETDHAGNSLEAQRTRLLDWLRQRSISTLEARRHLDILMPAARVFELRERGFSISTQRVRECTAAGKPHSVARYVLMRETLA